jgi:hypothetical protein
VSTRYLYSARLVPIGTPVRIPYLVGGGSKVSTFTAEDFAIERTAKTKPPVWVAHDRNLGIGRIVQLYTDAGREWWCACFAMAREVPDDVEFEVGQPVSVGIHQGRSGGTYLDEISIVPRSAVKGAEITRRYAFEPARNPTPLPDLPAAGPTTSDRAAAGETYDYRPPLWDELEREVGLAVYDGASFERAMILHSRTPAEKLLDEVMAAKRGQVAPGVLIRPGSGQVLGVR